MRGEVERHLMFLRDSLCTIRVTWIYSRHFSVQPFSVRSLRPLEFSSQHEGSRSVMKFIAGGDKEVTKNTTSSASHFPMTRSGSSAGESIAVQHGSLWTHGL